MSTIFQKIIDREIAADIVYEDDQVLAFLDIQPINKGHTLVIPKTAFADIFEADPEAFGYLAKVAMHIGQGIKTALNADGVNLIMNNGAAAGQEVFHAHIHVVPRFVEDNVFATPKHTTYDDDESAHIATQIMATLTHTQ